MQTGKSAILKAAQILEPPESLPEYLRADGHQRDSPFRLHQHQVQIQGLSNPWPTSRIHPRRTINAAPHKTINLLNIAKFCFGEAYLIVWLLCMNFIDDNVCHNVKRLDSPRSLPKETQVQRPLGTNPQERTGLQPWPSPGPNMETHEEQRKEPVPHMCGSAP